MNCERLRPSFAYKMRVSGNLRQGVVWIFSTGRPRRRHHLVFETATRRFRCGRKHPNGYGTHHSVQLPHKVTQLLRSMIPEDELARALALSVTQPLL